MVEPASEYQHVGTTDAVNNGSSSSAEQALAQAKQTTLSSGTVNASPESTSQPASPAERHLAEQLEQSDGLLNGHAASESSQQQNGTSAAADFEEGSLDAPSSPPQEPVEEPWRKRLYFVRMPKFPEDNQYALTSLQEEIDVYRGQVQLLNESMNIVRVSPSSSSCGAAVRSCNTSDHEMFLCTEAYRAAVCTCRCSVTAPRGASQRQEKA